MDMEEDMQEADESEEQLAHELTSLKTYIRQSCEWGAAG